MSLRTRLIAGMLALFVVALVSVNLATYFAVERFLLHRIDVQLDQARAPAMIELAPNRPTPHDGGGRMPSFLPPGTYIELRDSTGTLVNARYYGFGTDVQPPPDLPGVLSAPSTSGGRLAERRFDTAALDGSARYRVLVSPSPSGDTIVIAVPLTDVDDTLSQLRLIEFGVSGVAGLAALVLASWLIREGLRPLERMAAVADDIAAGDLSRRAENANPRTEVGRLAIAFNEMLARIEEAFQERLATEERLRRFVSDASHELRTPLTSIRGYAELFSGGQGRPAEDTARAMQRIDEQATRMSSLVEDLLLLARLDEHQPLESQPVDLALLAADAVADATVADSDREYRLEAVPLVVEGDERRLRQVLANLLANERVHTPTGTIVTVRIARREGGAVIEVEDNGPGFPPGVNGKVFERFYRADASRSRDSGGSGLGLSIVASIVGAHGGQVSATNMAPNAGARITIELPEMPFQGEG
ncbi:MAG: HAMP domain-containing histidine kinase [Dehalococcoidia bacterium]|nr:HAMP domain-containing histidine kinase [Dehalococcoidia bacterium]